MIKPWGGLVPSDEAGSLLNPKKEELEFSSHERSVDLRTSRNANDESAARCDVTGSRLVGRQQ